MQGPNNGDYDRKPTAFDNLSDEELRALINATGKVKVAPIRQPVAKKHIDLDALLGDK